MKIKEQAKQKLKHNSRFQALQVLYQIEYEGEYSNVLINRWLQETTASAQDQGLFVQLVYGTVQRRYTLDYYLSDVIKGKQIKPWVKSLLRMSVYQLVYLDRIPQHAVLNEAVTIAKLNGHATVGNFVNALLRRFLREPLKAIEAIADPLERLRVQYSVEPDLVKLLQATYGAATTEQLLASLNTRPRLTGRSNQVARAALLQELTEQGYRVQAGTLSPDAVESLDGQLVHTPAFQSGQLTVQDEASMLVAPLGRLQAGMNVLDACSAPGGKATHIAALLGAGHLTALDLSEKKLAKVQAHMVRLGLTENEQLHLTFQACDARQFQPADQQQYDVIYLDAPCSGLGLMRRKPEIKYTKTLADIEALVAIQQELLAHCATLLKDGGTLVYSTCTIAPQENTAQVTRFLAQQPAFELDPIQVEEVGVGDILTVEGMVQILPHQHQTDGFFIARLHKKSLRGDV